jgi:MFS family permease
VSNTPTIAGDAPPRARRLRLAAIPVIGSLSLATWIRIVLLAGFCAFYVWTAATTTPIRFTSGADGVHGRLADAFLHGRLDLGSAPELEGLSNPYDPQQNGAFQGQPENHDLSYYNGKLYSYWGPAPALLVFAPARLLGFAFSQTLAIAGFAFLGLLFSVLLLLALQRRFAPQAAAWKVNAGVLLLGFANALPYTIRRPDKYEVAIAAGLCFAMLGTWLLMTALLRERADAEDEDDGPSVRRLALGSLALGLAVASRPSHVLTVGGIVLLSVWLLRGTPRARLRPVALALLGPVVGIGVLLALYNYARFDSFTEFGLSYQLAGVDVTARSSFQFAYMKPGLWYYLIAPPRLLLLFPFVELPPPPLYPWHLPKVYDGIEPTGGVFPLAPITLLLAAVPLLARRMEPALRAVLLVFVVVGLSLAAFAAAAFWGATMRYEVDFATFLLLAALLVWLRMRSRVVTIVGVAAIAWSAFAGLALSFSGQYQPLRTANPGLWAALTRDTSPLSRLGVKVLHGGPTIAEVNAIGLQSQGRSYLKFDDQHSDVLMTTQPIGVSIVMPKAGATHLRAIVSRGPGLASQSRVDLAVLLPDGQQGTLPLTANRQELDLPLSLKGGVQQLQLAAAPQEQPTQPVVLILQNLRVE